MSREKIVLAYSGGLDTSVAIKWLQQKYNYDVIAMIADCGEGKNLTAIKEKALAIGAIECLCLDLKAEFAEHYLAKALQANALYEGVYPLISALSRPLIAEKLIDIARQEQAVAVAHGCTGKGNDQVRFDVSLNTLNPHIKIVAPVRENPMSREQSLQYAEEHHIPVPIAKSNPFSIDSNLWGRSCECGVLEDPWQQAPEEAYALTRAAEQGPEQAEIVVISFKQGVACALNGEEMPLHNLVAKLNIVAGAHGVGRIDHVENRLVGIKSREIYEAPAAMTLIKAHQALEALCLTRDSLSFKTIVEQRYTQLIYDGLWFSPLFHSLSAFIADTQKAVSGEVKVKLYKGHAAIVGRQSAYSLYSHQLATYNPDDQFDHQAAKGFIKLFGLPLELHSLVHGEKE